MTGFRPTAEFIPELAGILRDRRLALLTGAGVSMLAPSSLPSWWRLNIDAFRAFAGADPLLLDYTSHIETLTLPAAVLAQFLSEILGDQPYSEFLNSALAASPNQNHMLIAGLARVGLLADVLTLNLDTLQEQAFRQTGVLAHTILETPGERPTGRGAEHRGSTCLFKLHGSIGHPGSVRCILDNTTQSQGIGDYNKDLIAGVREKCHVLVLGYSGLDLFLDQDYLGLLSRPTDNRLYWNVLPGEIKSADHCLMKLQANCPQLVICEGTLPDTLETLANSCGVTHDAAATGTISERPHSAWSPPEGAWPGHLFSKVFRHVADADRELACYKWEANQALDYPGPYRAGWALEGLGAWYLEHGHRDVSQAFLKAANEIYEITNHEPGLTRARRAIGQLYQRYPPGSAQRAAFGRELDQLARDDSPHQLAELGLKFYNKALEKRQADFGVADADQNLLAKAAETLNKALTLVEDKHTQLRATILGNLGLVLAHQGQREAAFATLDRALQIEEALKNPAGIAYHLRNIGELHLTSGSPQDGIGPLMRSAEIDSGSASVQRRAHTLGMLGDALAQVGRKDDAIRAYEQAAAVAKQSDSTTTSHYFYDFVQERLAKIKGLDEKDRK